MRGPSPPDRPQHPSGRRRSDELLHRHLAAGIQGHRQRHRASRDERADLIYALSVSTHDPSTVTADEHGPIYYQQQVLATVPRAAFGAGY
jgi:hypothetical protein